MIIAYNFFYVKIVIFWRGENIMECVNLEDFLKNKGAFEKASIIKKNNEEVCIALNNEDELFKLIVPKIAESRADSAHSQNLGQKTSQADKK